MSNDFVYDLPTDSPEEVTKSLNNFPQTFDTCIEEGVTLFRPYKGVNKIRLLPPRNWKTQWPGEEFNGILGLKIYTHFYLTAAGDFYLCNRVMKNEPCPFCEVFDRYRKGDWSTAKAYSPYPRILLWLVDFSDQAEEPGQVKLWIAPTSVVTEILEAAYDDEAKRYAPLFSLTDGYMIRFRMTKEHNMNKYSGVKLLSPKPLEESVLREIKPYDELLVFYPYEHMKKKLDATLNVSSVEVDDNKPSFEEMPSSSLDIDEEVVDENDELVDEDLPF